MDRIEQIADAPVDRFDIPEEADLDDDFPIRGTRSLTEVYERCNAAMIEPANFREAAKSEVWRNAMQEEINMIEKNRTWDLVDIPTTRTVIQVKWIFKRKLT